MINCFEFCCWYLVITHFPSRKILQSVESRRQNEADDEERALAEKVNAATWEHLHAGILKDVKLIKDFQASAQADAAAEAALDQKYLKERQKSL